MGRSADSTRSRNSARGAELFPGAAGFLSLCFDWSWTRSPFLLRHGLGDGTQDLWQHWNRGKLPFLHDVMRPGAGIRLSPFAQRLKSLTGWKDLHVEEIIANQRDDFAVGVESVFAEHRSRGKAFWLAEFRQQEFNGFFLSRHVDCPSLIWPRRSFPGEFISRRNRIGVKLEFGYIGDFIGFPPTTQLGADALPTAHV